MDQLKWDEVMPEVSERFHSRVENSLAFIEKKDERKQTMRVKHKLVFAAAAVLVFGSITASAAGLLRWNSNVADSFEVDEVRQEQLIEQGVAEVYETAAAQDDDTEISGSDQDGQIIAEDNGVTITLLQTIQDARYLYVAIQVDAPEELQINDNFMFEYWRLGNPDDFPSYSARWMNEEANIYEIWAEKDPAADLNGKTMNLTLENLQGDEGKLEFYTALEGTWELSWDMNFEDNTETFEIGETVTIEGYEVTVERMEISPISSVLYYSGSDLEAFREEYSMKRDDLLYDADIYMELKQVKYEDQTMREEFMGGGGSAMLSDGIYSSSQMFDKMLDTEGLESIFIGSYEDLIEISLK